MIDRARRDRMAELLRHFAAGLLTNDEIEDRLHPIISRPFDIRTDPALWAVRTRAWFLYDDTRCHRLRGKWELAPEARQEICRWIVFLYSNLEYEWPVRSFISIPAFLVNLLTLGMASLFLPKLMRRHYESMGEWRLWPFIRRNDFERALRQPRLLRGS